MKQVWCWRKKLPRKAVKTKIIVFWYIDRTMFHISVLLLQQVFSYYWNHSPHISRNFSIYVYDLYLFSPHNAYDVILVLCCSSSYIRHKCTFIVLRFLSRSAQIPFFIRIIYIDTWPLSLPASHNLFSSLSFLPSFIFIVLCICPLPLSFPCFTLSSHLALCMLVLCTFMNCHTLFVV